MVDRVTLGQVLPKYFGFICHLSFHRSSVLIWQYGYHPANTIYKLCPTYQVHCLTPRYEFKGKEEEQSSLLSLNFSSVDVLQ